ncbi:MAG: hypothetical protein ACH255_21265, partial [Candidatus Thiodiazotropha sp.]
MQTLDVLWGKIVIYFKCAMNNLGWSGGAMVLGKLPVPGRPTIWIRVAQGVGVVWTFLLSSALSF